MNRPDTVMSSYQNDGQFRDESLQHLTERDEDRRTGHRHTYPCGETLWACNTNRKVVYGGRHQYTSQRYVTGGSYPAPTFMVQRTNQ